MSENTEGLDYQPNPRPSLAGQPASHGAVAGQGSVIGPTLVVKGHVTAEEDLLIRGRVEGIVDHNQTLTVHQDGTVEAVVRAKEIHVEGTVEGDLFGTQRVSVLETGKVCGNVVAPRIGVMEGAQFKGMVDMDPDTAAIERRYQEHSKASAGKTTAPADAAQNDSGKTKLAAKAGGRRGNAKGDAEEQAAAADVSSVGEAPAAEAGSAADKEDDAKAS